MNMRLMKVIPVILLLIAVSPVYGQTILSSSSGHERQMGPVERSIYLVQRPDMYPSASSYRTVWQDTSTVPHAHAYSLIGGGIGGGMAGLVAAVYLTSLVRFDSSNDILPFLPQMMVGALAVAVLEPLGMATGVHLANKGRGDYCKVVGSAYGSFWIGMLAISGIAVTGIGREAPGFATTLFMAIPIYQLGRTIRKELITSGGRHQP
jgi:hypothetical protein